MRTFAQEQKQPQKPVSSSLVRSNTSKSGLVHREHPILHLQRSIGNQAAQRALQTNAEECEAGLIGPASPRLRHDFSRIPIHPRSAGAIQTKLAINKPGDEYEQEADRAADQVTRTPNAQLQHSYAGGERPIRRAQQPGQEQWIEETNDAKTNRAEESVATPTLNDMLHSPGQPLDANALAFFEPRFSCSFSNVRVHTDAQADQSARALNAEAYTVGMHIVFGQSRAAINTLAGIRLLAHELTHVVQQNTLHPPVNSSGDAPAHAQRDAQRTEPDWHQKLDEILPRQVGLITVIDRMTMLIDIFGDAKLKQHVELIHADSAAKRFTQIHGVPGIVALYDTSRGNQLDVTAAQQALTNLPDRYKRTSLEKLRLMPEQEVPSYWFNDPASQQRPGQGGGKMSSSQQRAQVYIEGQLSQVGKDISVRFAYPETEVSSGGESSRVKAAKGSVLRAIAQVVADIGSLPPAADQKERREQETVRARLREALRGLGSSSPLNVYISTEPTPTELVTGQVAALTDRVFVSLQDVGDPARLQAAIGVPLMMLRGGVLPGRGGIQQVPAASQADIQRTLLHEALHALLIRQSSDANAIWESKRAQLVVQGSPSAGSMLVELIRKYLIAQEEVFAYENAATLYPPVSQIKSSYDVFIVNVEHFLSRRLALNTVSRSIPVTQKVARQNVTWTITYQMPSGTIDLTANDIKTLGFLLGTYPLG